MNPFLILGLVIGAIVLMNRKSSAATAAPAPVPSGGKVPLSLQLPPGTLVQSEVDLITNGTAAHLYQAAMQSRHKLFVGAAATKLATLGDGRSKTLAKRFRTLPDDPIELPAIQDTDLTGRDRYWYRGDNNQDFLAIVEYFERTEPNNNDGNAIRERFLQWVKPWKAKIPMMHITDAYLSKVRGFRDAFNAANNNPDLADPNVFKAPEIVAQTVGSVSEEFGETPTMYQWLGPSGRKYISFNWENSRMVARVIYTESPETGWGAQLTKPTGPLVTLVNIVPDVDAYEDIGKFIANYLTGG